MRDAAYVYQNTDTGDAAPAAVAGTVTPVAGGWTIADGYVLPLFMASDTGTSLRAPDDLDVQLLIRVDAGANVGVVVSDGSRAGALLVGSTSIDWVVPSTLASYGWTWGNSVVQATTSHVVRIRKSGSARWSVWIDGELRAEIPYQLSESAATGPSARIGRLSGSGTTSCLLGWYELGLNTPVAPYRDVARVVNSLPSSFRDTTNTQQRGIAMVIAGTHQFARIRYDALRRLKGAGRVVVDSASFDGAAALATPWALSGVTQSVVRQRIRIAYSTGGWATYALPSGRPADTETRVTATFTVRGTPTTDANGATGVYFGCDDGTKLIVAGLYAVGAGTGVGWRLGYTSVKPGQTYPWWVDASHPHRVEVFATASMVLLVVDGTVVDRAAYSSMPASIAGTDARVGITRNCGATLDVEGFSAERSLSDQSSRPHLRLRASERLFHPSGIERGEELRQWLDRRVETLSIRGTERGLLSEVARMAGADRVYLMRENTPAAWVLNVTLPGFAWLDLDGSRAAFYLEFSWYATVRTLEALARLVLAYHLPLSTAERAYYACLVTAATAGISPGTAVVVPVESSRGFATGNACLLRTFAGTASEAVTIAGIPSATSVTLTSVSGTYAFASATPPILRKILGSTLAAWAGLGAAPTPVPVVPVTPPSTPPTAVFPGVAAALPFTVSWPSAATFGTTSIVALAPTIIAW